jgi:2-amino-4-hydroxy-6-hydroxymethyldihydropteridine diphosphokinase
MNASPVDKDLGSALGESRAAPVWQPAYVGIGSNLDDPREQVQRALAALAELPGSRLVLCSPLYRTAPLVAQGGAEQPAYVNAVAGMLTRLSPEELLAGLGRIESALGRPSVRERWAPRRIDLDLLVHGRETRATGTLKLPHPGVAERDFVLWPLADIAPDLEVPGLGRVAVLRARVADRGMVKL